jgi:hypothetical protein
LRPILVRAPDLRDATFQMSGFALMPLRVREVAFDVRMA